MVETVVVLWHFCHRTEIDCSLRSDSQLKFEKYDFKYAYMYFNNTVFHNIIATIQNNLVTVNAYF